MHSKLLFIFIFFSAAVFAKSQTLDLVNNNRSNYKIILSASASRWDSAAAGEFRKYIEQITSVLIPIISDSSPASQWEIVFGKNKHSEHIDITDIREDGFLIRTNGNHLYFLGGGKRGTLNAVYTFLEKYLDCRMYSSEAKVIPSKSSIKLPQINLIENPAFEYRSIYYYEANNDEYCRWHKLVDSDDKKIWGMFVHTFQHLLPVERYFEEHPEYFALRGNIRVPDEPCLSNPDVFRIMTKELRERMGKNPTAEIWSVSQNDNFSYCQCPSCSKIDEQEGSPSGSVILFVNKIAREFPDKIISTLAYQYSRKAPENIKPEKNVNIMLCTIESYRTKPLAEDTSASAFIKDLIEWTKLTNHIFLWDYVVQFSNYISPFPNLHVLQPNLQLFKNHNIRMMFQQGAGTTGISEFGELRTYLISKLLWNPDINIDSIMNDFLSGYYGKAGRHIRSYIDLMRTELINSDAQLWIYSNPVEQMKDFLNPELLKKYNALFDSAEVSVSSEPVYAERVKTARLPLMYAALEQAKVLGSREGGILVNMRDTDYAVNPAIISLLNSFVTYAGKKENVLINEKGLTPGKYSDRYRTMLSKTMKNPIGLHKQVRYLTSPNWKYPANGERSLTDGIRGDEDHLFNWVGYEGNDMEVLIDLQQKHIVKKVSADFLQIVFSWIFLPEEIEVSTSLDGNNFSNIKKVINTTTTKKEEVLSPIHSFIKDFSCEYGQVEARYIKVKAKSIKSCPPWHPGVGGKAWIFTDEIVVE